ncbi:MAG: ABC transporter substrate-binding protein [Bacilli bacterium]|nr:ABC transporter substrate-binding protein [Bacilli bacterium]
MKINKNKGLFIAVLSSALVLSACGGGGAGSVNPGSSSELPTSQGSQAGSQPVSGGSSAASSQTSTPGSSQAPASSQGGSTSTLKYTYNTYLSTKPKTWNVHTWETSDESYIPAFTECGFYDLKLNAKKDGYEIVSEMASDYPIDVSNQIEAEELAMYGYSGNLAEGYVWDIPLNRNACWEDGTKITANDYIESMKRQLDPLMVNFRADSYYSSSLVIANADRYAKQGNEIMEALYNYVNLTTGKVDADFDGYYYININKYTPYVASVFSNADETTTLYTVLNQCESSDSAKLAAQRVLDAVYYYCWKFIDHTESADKDKWDEIKKVTDVKAEMCDFDINTEEFNLKDVKVRATLTETADAHSETYSEQKLQADLATVVAAMHGPTNKAWNWRLPLFGKIYNDYEQTWGDEDGATSGVGIVKVDNYKIRLFLAKQMTALDLKFSLTGNWLVKTDLYDRLKVNTGGLVVTKYATPDAGVAGYMSYGPYKLSDMEAGKQFKIVKNEKWYGYSDGKHVGEYMMDSIYTRIIPDHDTAKQEFLAGKLDDFDLNRTDMKTYGNSSRLTRTYESYTQKISFNSDRPKLLERQSSASNNKTILANENFRKGLSLGMDRNNFASQTTAGSKAFTALLNDLYLTEVETGEMYRNTAQGKAVYNMVYGKLGGDKNPFAPDYNEATDATPLSTRSNGFNFKMATYYVAQGLKEELESTETGHIVPNAKIALEFRVYDNESETTKDMLAFISQKFSDVVAAAVTQLKEEGVLKSSENITIEVKAQKDEDYYNTAKKGGYDMIFSTWGGAAINPQGLMEVYCKSDFDSTCEYGFKGKQDNVYIKIDANGNGEFDADENKSFNKWYIELNDIVETDERGSAAWTQKHNRILNILSGLEAGILNRFEAVPLVARATSSINSFKIENGTTQYINLVGYGGVRAMTFNYTNDQWTAFLKSHNNDLSELYKD